MRSRRSNTASMRSHGPVHWSEASDIPQGVLRALTTSRRSKQLEDNIRIEAFDVFPAAQSGPPRKQRGRTRRDAVPKRVLHPVPLGEAPHHGAKKTIARADGACRFDRQGGRTPYMIARDQKCATIPEGEGDYFRASCRCKSAARVDPGVFVLARNAREFAQLAKIRLDEINAFFQSGRQRRPRGVENELHAAFLGDAGGAHIKIRGNPRRQTAAGDNDTRIIFEAGKRAEALTPILLRVVGGLEARNGIHAR